MEPQPANQQDIPLLPMSPQPAMLPASAALTSRKRGYSGHTTEPMTTPSALGPRPAPGAGGMMLLSPMVPPAAIDRMPATPRMAEITRGARTGGLEVIDFDDDEDEEGDDPDMPGPVGTGAGQNSSLFTSKASIRASRASQAAASAYLSVSQRLGQGHEWQDEDTADYVNACLWTAIEEDDVGAVKNALPMVDGGEWLACLDDARRRRVPVAGELSESNSIFTLCISTLFTSPVRRAGRGVAAPD